MTKGRRRTTPRLVELIGEERLSKILQGFAEATGGVATALDEHGAPIEFRKSSLRVLGKPLCRQLIQKKCVRLEQCSQRDRRAVSRAKWTKGPFLFRCPDSGLWEFAVAVRVPARGDTDEIIGYLYGGQIADADKINDGRFYPAKARRLGADPAEFMRLLQHNTVCTEEQVSAYAKLLGMLASDLSALAQEEGRDKAFSAASRTISAGPTLNLPDVLEQILSEIDGVLRPDETTIWLVDREDPNRLIAAHTHRGLPAFMPKGKEPFFLLKGDPKEMGAIGQVAAGRWPEIVDDVQAHPSDLKHATQVRRMGLRSQIALRLPNEGRLLGVLEVGSRQKGRYTAEDLELLRALGNDIVAALHNAQLYDDLQHQLARVVPEKEHENRLLKAQLAMFQAFAPGMDEEGVLRLLLREVLAVLRESNLDVAGNVRIVDPVTFDATLVSTEAAFDPGPARMHKVRPADDPLTGGVTRAGVALYLPDVGQSREFVAERDGLGGLQREFYDRIRSLLVYPIRRGPEVGGQLALYRLDGSGFVDSQLRIVGLLCEHAGVALANAFERRRVIASAELRQRLETIGARMAGLETREQTIEAAAREARRLIGDEYAVLMYMLPILDRGHLVLEQTAVSPDYRVSVKAVGPGRTRIPVGDALKTVLDQGEAVEVAQPNEVRYQFLLEGTRRALLAPMRYRYGGMLEGLIVAESPSGLPFGDWRRDALQLIASQLAVHVARSRTLAEDYAVFIHHFKSPMHFLEGLLREFDLLQKNETVSPALAASAQHARATMEQFRAYEGAFGRLNELRPEPVEVSRIVEEIAGYARREVGERQVTVRHVRSAGRRILVDPAVLKGAILELIHNAVGSDPEGNPVDITCEFAGGECMIRVRDRGRAISREQSRGLFELRNPMVRADEEPSGMGLWMVRTVVERQGGTVRLEYPGRTPKAFVITFPTADEQP